MILPGASDPSSVREVFARQMIVEFLRLYATKSIKKLISDDLVKEISYDPNWNSVQLINKDVVLNFYPEMNPEPIWSVSSNSTLGERGTPSAGTAARWFRILVVGGPEAQAFCAQRKARWITSSE